MNVAKTEVLTVKQTASILGIAVRTVHQRIETGALKPAGKLGGKTGAYFFDLEYIEALAAESSKDD